jgi:hypothetical protein
VPFVIKTGFAFATVKQSKEYESPVFELSMFYIPFSIPIDRRGVSLLVSL